MTTIEWTDASWNPVTGCTKVSPGCAHCYAERVADRLWAKQYPVVEIETSGPAGTETRARLFADVRCHEDRLDSPLHWKKPRMSSSTPCRISSTRTYRTSSLTACSR